MSPPPVGAAVTTTAVATTEDLSDEPEKDDLGTLALRFADWCLWYGKATERWWALSPAWCRERVGLVEADALAELAARMRHIEDFRPHPVPDQHEWPRRPLSGAERPATTPEPRPEGLGGSIGDAGSDESTVSVTGRGGDRNDRTASVHTRRRVR
ncbi:hypothetical protein ACSDR0_16190 [Streptosporangium sp. G11]|uniref:hypothetical protein n=1 Tax=Streptosporangium sp. G11 TaxID=3436926 RepID=UPI003EBD8F6E